jgi:hypothetical protein
VAYPGLSGRCPRKKKRRYSHPVFPERYFPGQKFVMKGLVGFQGRRQGVFPGGNAWFSPPWDYCNYYITCYPLSRPLKEILQSAMGGPFRQTGLGPVKE